MTAVAVGRSLGGQRRYRMRLEVEQEEDGRWLAEAPVLPGVMAYGASREEAIARVETLALRVLADRLEHGERAPDLDRLFAAA